MLEGRVVGVEVRFGKKKSEKKKGGHERAAERQFKGIVSRYRLSGLEEE